MAHTLRDKQKLLNRARRIKGQIEAVERSLLEECACIDILQQITSCRGAMNGLLVAVLEEHIRAHLVDPAAVVGALGNDSREQLISVVHSYFK
jgi:DNA-binding FrmR family transcriptional regulator